jgi:hypothetical protein
VGAALGTTGGGAVGAAGGGGATAGEVGRWPQAVVGVASLGGGVVVWLFCGGKRRRTGLPEHRLRRCERRLMRRTPGNGE